MMVELARLIGILIIFLSSAADMLEKQSINDEAMINKDFISKKKNLLIKRKGKGGGLKE